MSEVLWGFPPQIYQPLQNLVLKNEQIKETSHLGQSARIHLFKIPDKENRIARGPVVLAGLFSFLSVLPDNNFCVCWWEGGCRLHETKL